jgi:DNA-directed RNA polymerase specialized sigma24 family protein
MRRQDPLANPEPLIRRVYAYVAYRLGDGPDAEDVTNDVFERALRYRASFDESRGQPIAWLLGIARRCVDGDVGSDVVSRMTLAAAIEGLDERERDLLALRYGADLTARQIGDLLGLRTNAVEVALHRALARLRKELADAGAAERQLSRDPAADAPS